MELGLVELMEQLKKDIGKLQYSHPLMFNIKTVELELKFVVDKTLDATGKAHWVLFAAEAKAEYKDQHVNTVKLTLTPLIGVTGKGELTVNAGNDLNWAKRYY